MDRKGTGWVPDFPDVKDYTLSSNEIQTLAGQVRTERSMGAVEDLAKRVSQALKLLTNKRSATEEQSATDTEVTDANTESLTQLERLIDQFDKEACGGIRFASVNVLKSFKPGMYGSEIPKIKQYLKRLYSSLPEVHREDYYLNPVFDDFTAKLIQDFKEDRGLNSDSVVDIQTMDALRWSDSLQEARISNLQDSLTSSRYYYSAYNNFQGASPDSSEEIFNFLSRLQENSESLTAISITVEDNAKSLTELGKKGLEKFEATKTVQRIIELFDPSLDLADPNIDKRISEGILRQKIEGVVPEILDKIPKIRSATLEFLDKVGVEPTPALKRLLNPSRTSKSSESKIQDEIRKVNSSDSIEGSDAVSAIKAIKEIVDEFITEISYLPQYLLPAKCDSSVFGVEEFIQPVTLENLFEYIFIKLIPEQYAKRIDELIKPVTWSEYEVVSYETAEQDYTSFVRKQREDGEKRLGDQFLVLISSEQEASNAVQGASRAEIDNAIDNFAKCKPIPQPRDPSEISNEEKIDDSLAEFEHYAEKKIYHNAVASEVAIAVKQELTQLIQPVVEVIVRLILPLGQYANYRDAAEEGMLAFRKLVEDGGSTKLREANSDKSLHLRGIALVAILKVYERLKDQHHPLAKKIIRSAVERYKLPTEDQLKSEISSSQSGATAPLLEVISTQNGPADYFDLKIPIGWGLHQKIQTHYEKQPKIVEGRRKMYYLRLPEFVDLSLWCSDIEDQGSLNSCTAHAGVALTEYFAKRSFGKYTDVSPLFLYKTARNLMQRQGDSGASVRETMKAMVLFGIPPEEHWPYDEARYDEEPTQFCYSFAQNYQALKYFRLDYAGIAEDELLIQAKAVLAAGFPCMFGFTLYTSVYHKTNHEQGHIPYPDEDDQMEGGHAVVAVGYDDSHTVENADGKRSQGAILIRNSWGAEWGKGGYGWLPYDYVLAGLTADWWSLLKSEWFESGQFGIGSGNWTSNVGGRPRDGD